MWTDPKITARDVGVHGDRAELEALEDRLQSFVADIADARIDESDEHESTREYVRRLADADFLRYVAPAAHGGAHAQVRSTPLCLIRQWLARHSGALDTAFVMQGLGSNPVNLGGSDALAAALLPRVVRGEAICAFALTEPDAGSDVSGMQTTAHPHGDGVRLEGEKCWISNAGVADSYVVFAREGVQPEGEKPSFGAFWVPGDAPGLSVEPMQVIAPHPIGRVKFDGVVVPGAHRLGEPGKGLRIALANLDVFRVTVGAAALGLADRALAETTAHLKTRVQFGKPLAKQQGLRFALADVATDHVASQLLVYRAAGARDRGHASPDQAAMAKLHATESAQRTIDRAVQSFGGRGVTVGEAVERLYREVRALRIYEGTSEIQKLVIARSML
ncbi:MAG: acyl-CoA dehydrogenase family protein [Nannocystaceae bacterium]|nr:acyl-CoA dehydrogenase [bacterium]